MNRMTMLVNRWLAIPSVIIASKGAVSCANALTSSFVSSVAVLLFTAVMGAVSVGIFVGVNRFLVGGANACDSAKFAAIALCIAVGISFFATFLWNFVISNIVGCSITINRVRKEKRDSADIDALYTKACVRRCRTYYILLTISLVLGPIVSAASGIAIAAALYRKIGINISICRLLIVSGVVFGLTVSFAILVLLYAFVMKTIMATFFDTIKAFPSYDMKQYIGFTILENLLVPGFTWAWRGIQEFCHYQLIASICGKSRGEALEIADNAAKMDRLAVLIPSLCFLLSAGDLHNLDMDIDFKKPRNCILLSIFGVSPIDCYAMYLNRMCKSSGNSGCAKCMKDAQVTDLENCECRCAESKNLDSDRRIFL